MAGWMEALKPKRPVKKTREQRRAERSPSYQWWRHAASLAAISATVIVVSASQLREVAAWQWVCFASFLVFLNFSEYWLHRIPFHNPIIPDFTYYGHISHHGFFSYKRMEVDEMNDLRFVMFEVWIELLMFGVAALIATTLYLHVNHNLAWLYMIAVAAYYSVYEFTHAMSHLPEDSPLGGLRIVKAFSLHHRIHHDPRLMRRYNFNFAIPIFDWMFRTVYHGVADTGAETTARASTPAAESSVSRPGVARAI